MNILPDEYVRFLKSVMPYELGLSEGAKPPEILHHYTSVDALYSMAKRKAIWASDVFSMNDRSEAIHAGRHVAGELSKRRGDIPDDVPTWFTDESIVRVLGNQVFVASLSAEGDALALWEAYGLKGSGYAVGFSTDALTRSHMSCTLVKVQYSEDALAEHAQTIIEIAISEAKGSRLAGDREWSFWRHVASHLLQVLVRYKNAAFKSENEWRLISLQPPQSPPIESRVVGTCIVPYATLQIPDDAIRTVSLGPRCGDREHRSLSSFFRLIQMNHVEVRRSMVPLR